ncbi:hypothetical protein [Bdellovibrio sp. NC01]|uniref:hypothetical protein n=1 Tax=Bdellovibrio sp. NC01 TaxID=2220073 RepID=UPI001FEDB989|nr:hypothetical protein [Bdellovibrio sp. NC01]
MMMRIALLGMMILATGCSMDATLQSLAQNPGSVIKAQDPAKTTGLVSGSTQTGTASGGGGATYQVQSTVGSYMSGIEQTTSDGSYKVYSSVQGAIVSN